MSAAAKVAAALAKYGRPMTLRRRVGTTSAFSDVTVKGVADGYKPAELVGGIVQGDRQVTISNAEIAAAAWPGPPKKGDFVMIDGVQTAVQGVETKHLATDILAHVLWVRG
ncbi:hypothetical protein [Arenibaculum pallidiluteum]|uniref:hypothetical protein n=1 Tax=Arenibaculum pallidiluteum TaxID=2812559 RepID=UPI001A96DDB1|nr:hypothetical protein [Arenibaculum pallidiluteum]